MQGTECFKIKELSALPKSARDLLSPSMGAVEPLGEFLVDSRALVGERDSRIEA